MGAQKAYNGRSKWLCNNSTRTTKAISQVQDRQIFITACLLQKESVSQVRQVCEDNLPCPGMLHVGSTWVKRILRLRKYYQTILRDIYFAPHFANAHSKTPGF